MNSRLVTIGFRVKRRRTVYFVAYTNESGQECKEVYPTAEQARNRFKEISDAKNRRSAVTLDDVKQAVERIREYAAIDDASAHSLEDTLYRDVLNAIAHRECDDPVALALYALTTKEIEFNRRCE